MFVDQVKYNGQLALIIRQIEGPLCFLLQLNKEIHKAANLSILKDAFRSGAPVFVGPLSCNCGCCFPFRHFLIKRSHQPQRDLGLNVRSGADAESKRRADGANCWRAGINIAESHVRLVMPTAWCLARLLPTIQHHCSDMFCDLPANSIVFQLPNFQTPAILGTTTKGSTTTNIYLDKPRTTALETVV